MQTEALLRWLGFTPCDETGMPLEHYGYDNAVANAAGSTISDMVYVADKNRALQVTTDLFQTVTYARDISRNYWVVEGIINWNKIGLKRAESVN